MADEVEADFKKFRSIGHRRGIQPTRAYIERNIPPVCLQRAEREPRLAHDLRPHVQGVRSLLPVCPFELRPDVRTAAYWQKTSMPKRKIQKTPMVCQYQAVQSTTIWRSSIRRKKMSANIEPASASTPISKCRPWVPVIR